MRVGVRFQVGHSPGALREDSFVDLRVTVLLIVHGGTTDKKNGNKLCLRSEVRSDGHSTLLIVSSQTKAKRNQLLLVS